MAEYLLGIALILQGLQMPTPVIPTVAGLAVLLNAASVRGPLGAFRVVDRAGHAAADVVLMVALLAVAVQPFVAMDLIGRAMLAMVAVVLAVIWFHTDFGERVRGPRATGEERARSAGRLAGLMAKRLRSRSEP